VAILNINNQKVPVEQKKLSYDLTDMKKEQNANIVEAQLKVSSHDGPTVMSLLLRTTIEEINKHIAISDTSNTGDTTDTTNTNESTIQKAYESNLDVSPKATAERILNGATSFFNAYKEQNSDLTESEALTQFMGVIRSGIDAGFGQARDVLESLSVLEGEIAGNIDLTYDTVQIGLNDFSEKTITAIEENSTQ